MIELELSTIPDSDIDLATLKDLCNEFGKTHNANIRIRTMTWGNAWTELMTITSQGKGPHISHIGGTWTSSLIMMNALRPFQPNELAATGGPSAFLNATWDSTMLFGNNQVYALPWTGYIYVICYRKDLLKQAGIDEATAFGTVDAFQQTIERLRHSRLDIPWLNPPIPAPYNDYLHTAASWIWGAGGMFIDEHGKQLVFDSPKAQRGLTLWLESYRAAIPTYADLGSRESVDLFAQGQVAAVLTDIRVADSFTAGDAAPIVRANLGVAPLTNVPWCGGANLVIWQHTRGYPDKERTAVALVQFLVNKENQLRWARAIQSMPARIDALQEIYPPEHPLHHAIEVTIKHGQSYMSVPLWRRLEFQIAQELGALIAEARQNPDSASADIVREHMEALAQRLNITFSG